MPKDGHLCTKERHSFEIRENCFAYEDKKLKNKGHYLHIRTSTKQVLSVNQSIK